MKFIVYCHLFFLATSSSAMTGNQALQHLVSNGEPRNELKAYVDGLMNAEQAVLFNAIAAKKGGVPYVPPFCAPSTSSPAQGAQIVYKELRDNPAKNHEWLGHIARRALVSAWPCSDEQMEKY